MARRCCGTTRSGKQCSITSASTLVDDRGRLAAGLLKHGFDNCLYHAKPFETRPAAADDSRPCVLILLDLETTGTDIYSDRIVELAAAHAPMDPRFLGGGFSTVVRVDPNILEERGAQAALVHGISDAEIGTGPDFCTAWRRFRAWVEDLLNTAVVESDDSDDDDNPRPPRLPSVPPVLLIAGHNAMRFDFPLLLCECLRHGMPCDCFERWLFVDTLHVLQAVKKHDCHKLQCSVRALGSPADLRAHRASVA